MDVFCLFQLWGLGHTQNWRIVITLITAVASEDVKYVLDPRRLEKLDFQKYMNLL